MSDVATETITPLWLAGSLLVLMVSGLCLLLWGRKLLSFRPGLLRWSLVAPLVLVLSGIFAGWQSFLEDGSQYWMKGWIGGTDLLGAVTAGLSSDPVGLSAAGILLTVVVLHLIAVDPLWSPDRAERICASFAMSTAGSILTWQALTPWVGGFGITLCAFGGFIGLGTTWHNEEDGRDAIHFAFERTALISLALLGASIFLFRQSPAIWKPGGETTGALSPREIMGAALLAAAVFAQSNAFPLLSGLRGISRGGRFVALQLLPFWALFGMFLRMSHQFSAVGVFPYFGWYAAAAGFFSIIYGLFQQGWRLSFGAWNSAGFSFSIAILALVGPREGVAALLGFSIPSAAIALLTGAAREDLQEDELDATRGNKAARAMVFFSFAMATGIIGSLNTNAVLGWIARDVPMPALLAIPALCWLAFVMLGWRLAWKVPKVFGIGGWASLFPAGILCVLSLGLVWSGSFSGGVLKVLNAEDSLYPSLIDRVFSVTAGNSDGTTGASIEATHLAILCGVILFGIALAWWTSAGEKDRLQNLWKKMPATSVLIRNGFGVDRVGFFILAVAARSGAAVQVWIDQKFWDIWLPTGLRRSVFWLNRGMIYVEERTWPIFCSGLWRVTAIPGKLLQLLQNGDIRWYVFFALMSVLALAAHLFTRGGI